MEVSETMSFLRTEQHDASVYQTGEGLWNLFIRKEGVYVFEAGRYDSARRAQIVVEQWIRHYLNHPH